MRANGKPSRHPLLVASFVVLPTLAAFSIANAGVGGTGKVSAGVGGTGKVMTVGVGGTGKTGVGGTGKTGVGGTGGA